MDGTVGGGQPASADLGAGASFLADRVGAYHVDPEADRVSLRITCGQSDGTVTITNATLTR